MTRSNQDKAKEMHSFYAHGEALFNSMITEHNHSDIEGADTIIMDALANLAHYIYARGGEPAHIFQAALRQREIDVNRLHPATLDDMRNAAIENGETL